jgi:hypothetical protein
MIFEGANAKFCSKQCKDSHVLELESRVQKAVKADTSHTKKLSKHPN